MSSLTAQDTQGVTPIMQAAQQQDDSKIDALLKKNVPLTMTDNRGKTVLHYSVENDAPQIMEKLLQADPSLLEIKDKDGYTALQLATIAGNRPLIESFLNNNANVMTTDNEGHTPAHWVTVCGHAGLLDLLEDRGADLGSRDRHWARPMHYAAQMCGAASEGDRKTGMVMLKKLIAKGLPVDVEDIDKRSPLLWAASAGSPECIETLIDAGTPIDSADKDGLTALHCSASKGYEKCVDTLKRKGANLDSMDKNSCTPVFYSVTLGHANCTKRLLDAGADPNHRDSRGRTPSHCAAAKGYLEQIQTIQKKGGDVWMKSNRGECPIHEASLARQDDTVDYLLVKNEHKVNIPNNEGRTCLHIAALTNNLALAKKLVGRGAILNEKMKGWDTELTPYDAAHLKNFAETAEYLKTLGAKPAKEVIESEQKGEPRPEEPAPPVQEEPDEAKVEEEKVVEEKNEEEKPEEEEKEKVEEKEKDVETPTEHKSIEEAPAELPAAAAIPAVAIEEEASPEERPADEEKPVEKEEEKPIKQDEEAKLPEEVEERVEQEEEAKPKEKVAEVPTEEKPEEEHLVVESKTEETPVNDKEEKQEKKPKLEEKSKEVPQEEVDEKPEEKSQEQPTEDKPEEQAKEEKADETKAEETEKQPEQKEPEVQPGVPPTIAPVGAVAVIADAEKKQKKKGEKKPKGEKRKMEKQKDETKTKEEEKDTERKETEPVKEEEDTAVAEEPKQKEQTDEPEPSVAAIAMVPPVADEVKPKRKKKKAKETPDKDEQLTQPKADPDAPPAKGEEVTPVKEKKPKKGKKLKREKKAEEKPDEKPDQQLEIKIEETPEKNLEEKPEDNSKEKPEEKSEDQQTQKNVSQEAQMAPITPEEHQMDQTKEDSDKTIPTVAEQNVAPAAATGAAVAAGAAAAVGEIAAASKKKTKRDKETPQIPEPQKKAKKLKEGDSSDVKKNKTKPKVDDPNKIPKEEREQKQKQNDNWDYNTPDGEHKVVSWNKGYNGPVEKEIDQGPNYKKPIGKSKIDTGGSKIIRKEKPKDEKFKKKKKDEGTELDDTHRGKNVLAAGAPEAIVANEKGKEGKPKKAKDTKAAVDLKSQRKQKSDNSTSLKKGMKSKQDKDKEIHDNSEVPKSPKKEKKLGEEDLVAEGATEARVGDDKEKEGKTKKTIDPEEKSKDLKSQRIEKSDKDKEAQDDLKDQISPKKEKPHDKEDLVDIGAAGATVPDDIEKAAKTKKTKDSKEKAENLKPSKKEKSDEPTTLKKEKKSKEDKNKQAQKDPKLLKKEKTPDAIDIVTEGPAFAREIDEDGKTKKSKHSKEDPTSSKKENKGKQDTGKEVTEKSNEPTSSKKKIKSKQENDKEAKDTSQDLTASKKEQHDKIVDDTASPNVDENELLNISAAGVVAGGAVAAGVVASGAEDNDDDKINDTKKAVDKGKDDDDLGKEVDSKYKTKTSRKKNDTMKDDADTKKDRDKLLKAEAAVTEAETAKPKKKKKDRDKQIEVEKPSVEESKKKEKSQKVRGKDQHQGTVNNNDPNIPVIAGAGATTTKTKKEEEEKQEDTEEKPETKKIKDAKKEDNLAADVNAETDDTDPITDKPKKKKRKKQSEKNTEADSKETETATAGSQSEKQEGSALLKESVAITEESKIKKKTKAVHKDEEKSAKPGEVKDVKAKQEDDSLILDGAVGDTSGKDIKKIKKDKGKEASEMTDLQGDPKDVKTEGDIQNNTEKTTESEETQQYDDSPGTTNDENADPLVIPDAAAIVGESSDPDNLNAGMQSTEQGNLGTPRNIDNEQVSPDKEDSLLKSKLEGKCMDETEDTERNHELTGIIAGNVDGEADLTSPTEDEPHTQQDPQASTVDDQNEIGTTIQEELMGAAAGEIVGTAPGIAVDACATPKEPIGPTVSNDRDAEYEAAHQKEQPDDADAKIGTSKGPQEPKDKTRSKSRDRKGNEPLNRELTLAEMAAKQKKEKIIDQPPKRTNKKEKETEKKAQTPMNVPPLIPLPVPASLSSISGALEKGGVRTAKSEKEKDSNQTAKVDVANALAKRRKTKISSDPNEKEAVVKPMTKKKMEELMQAADEKDLANIVLPTHAGEEKHGKQSLQERLDQILAPQSKQNDKKKLYSSMDKSKQAFVYENEPDEKTKGLKVNTRRERDRIQLHDDYKRPEGHSKIDTWNRNHIRRGLDGQEPDYMNRGMRNNRGRGGFDANLTRESEGPPERWAQQVRPRRHREPVKQPELEPRPTTMASGNPRQEIEAAAKKKKKSREVRPKSVLDETVEKPEGNEWEDVKAAPRRKRELPKIERKTLKNEIQELVRIFEAKTTALSSINKSRKLTLYHSYRGGMAERKLVDHLMLDYNDAQRMKTRGDFSNVQDWERYLAEVVAQAEADEKALRTGRQFQTGIPHSDGEEEFGGAPPLGASADWYVHGCNQPSLGAIWRRYKQAMEDTDRRGKWDEDSLESSIRFNPLQSRESLNSFWKQSMRRGGDKRLDRHGKLMHAYGPVLPTELSRLTKEKSRSSLNISRMSGLPKQKTDIMGGRREVESRGTADSTLPYLDSDGSQQYTARRSKSYSNNHKASTHKGPALVVTKPRHVLKLDKVRLKPKPIDVAKNPLATGTCIHRKWIETVKADAIKTIEREKSNMSRQKSNLSTKSIIKGGIKAKKSAK